MMQIEQEKLGKQLKEIFDQRTELEKTDISKHFSHVTKGSLIKTDKGYFFLSIGLGKIIVEKETVFIISPRSPLGTKLLGKKENDSVEMNGVKYVIQKLILSPFTGFIQ